MIQRSVKEPFAAAASSKGRELAASANYRIDGKESVSKIFKLALCAG